VFAEARYIAWARKFYGRVPYDLASSGIPLVADAGSGADLADPGAYARLNEAIAHYNDRPVDEVVPALGTSQAVFLAYAAMLSPGDEILVESPGYEPLTRAAEGLGATVRTYARSEERGFAVDPSEVAAKIGPRTRAVVVTTLHNPSGVAVPDDTLRELAAIADARGAYLVVDEVYAPFEDLPEDGVFRRSARRLAPNVVAVGSLTKCYGLGMHRVGWVLGPPAVVAHAGAASIATVGHLPLAHAALGAAAFAELPRHVARAKTLSSGKREIAARWVASLPGARWSAPTSGLFGLVTLSGRGDLLEQIERVAAAKGVLVAAGSFFGAPSSFRLSWASCDAARFEEGLGLLDALVRA
jgi:aspartate/methionine/tyrosine aminotransferase